jgi:hypothetical protein
MRLLNMWSKIVPLLVLTTGLLQAAQLKYGQLVNITSPAFSNRPFWNWSGSGDVGAGPNPAGGPNTPYHMLIIGGNRSGTDVRPEDGCNLFFLRKASDHDNRGAVNFKDTIEIVSVADGYNYGQYFVRSSLFFAFNANRTGSGGQIITAEVSNENASNGNQLFTINSPTGGTGVISDGATVNLFSNALAQDVYISNNSYWPDDHQLAFTMKNADANAKALQIKIATRTPQNAAVWDKAVLLDTYVTHTAAPKDFDLEETDAENIACGSRNGKIETWAIGTDNTTLYRYDAGSMSANPWQNKGPAKDANNLALGALDDISVSSDGHMVVLTEAGRAFEYNWTTGLFEPLKVPANQQNLNLDAISIGNANNVWAVNIEQGTLYQYDSAKGWVLREGDDKDDNDGDDDDDDTHVSNVAAGADGTVVAVNEVGQAYMLDRANSTETDLAWIEMGDHDDLVEDIAVGDAKNIVATKKHTGTMVRWVDGDWVVMNDKDGKPSCGIENVAINAAGSMIITDSADNVYIDGEDGVEVVHAAPAAGKAAGESAAAHAVKAAKASIKQVAATVKKVVNKKGSRKAAKKAGTIKAPAKKTKAAKKAAHAAVAKAKAEGKPAPAGAAKAKGHSKKKAKVLAKKAKVAKKKAAKKAAGKKPAAAKTAKTTKKKALNKKAKKHPASKKAKKVIKPANMQPTGAKAAPAGAK